MTIFNIPRNLSYSIYRGNLDLLPVPVYSFFSPFNFPHWCQLSVISLSSFPRFRGPIRSLKGDHRKIQDLFLTIDGSSFISVFVLSSGEVDSPL